MKLKFILLQCFEVSIALMGITLISNNVYAKGVYNVHQNVSAGRIYNIDNKNDPKTRFINGRNRVNAKIPRLRLITEFPDSFHGGRFPQSINLNRKENNLYLGFDSYHPDGSKIIRYSLKKHRFHAGPTFKGGHAQGVSLNRLTNHLWLINKSNNNDGDDHAGIIKKGDFVEASTKTFKPTYRLKFNLKHGYYFNNTLTFTNHGAFISVDTKRHSRKYPYSFIFYHTNVLNHHRSNWRRLNIIIRHIPHAVTLECLAYNPKNKKLYVESETPNNIWSFPINKLLNNTLRHKNIRMARLSLKKEPEGLAFTDKGYAYLMFGGNRPWKGYIYKSRSPFSF